MTNQLLGQYGWWCASFPLTPALSLRERGNVSRSLAVISQAGFAEALAMGLPLPKGEGRGEGERDIRRPLRCKIAAFLPHISM
jgi:hypothetical protein